MKQFFYLSVFCVLAFTACTESFKKGEKGLEYKIISKGSGNTLKYGEFMQFHIKQVYNGTKDSVLQDSRDFMPRIQLFDSTSIPVEYYKILSKAKKGDSIVIRMLTDSIFKDPGQPMPPFMKKGKFLYLYFKIVNIFQTQQQVDSANKAEMVTARPRIYRKQMEMVEKEIEKNKAQIDADGQKISDYLMKNNIKATKGKWGTYMIIHTEGTGEKVTNNDIVTVNYTGKTLDSSIVFDSNIDPKFGHVQPYDVNMSELGGTEGVILGWTEALLQLKKGSKATVYIPSSLAYGKSGNGPLIKPDANLFFDIEVLNVSNMDDFRAKQEAMQKQMMDSLNNAPKK
ncbi:MAG TPA: FKBP-type peptidyl-prolyl cis-trans isomerase [Ferruginibacter sp.]|nr:FKBP-type peptidyl-prolyl cis-trans isomerase [Ferruginibacter sp.]